MAKINYLIGFSIGLLMLLTGACNGQLDAATATVFTATDPEPSSTQNSTPYNKAIATATFPAELPSRPLITAPTVLIVGGSGAAVDLQAEPGCSESYPQQGLVTLMWSFITLPKDEQLLAVTPYKNGFERDDVEIYGPLPPDQSSYILDHVYGQSNHYWRVMTKSEEGWVASETSVFVGPTCVADLQPSDP